MATLTVIAVANPGSPERPRYGEAKSDKPVSRRLLAAYFLCEPSDLEEISLKKGIEPIIRLMGKKKVPVPFYSVDKIPDLLEGLKERVIESGETEGREWLVELDTSAERFEIVRPNGSTLIFSKN